MSNTKGYKGMAMEGFIARSYDRNARKYSLAMYRNWAERIAPQIPTGGTVLEIAPGPGYFSIELAKRGAFRIFGLEISASFVEIARRNIDDAGVEVDVRHGNASEMPFADGMFDVVVCMSSFKNFSEPTRALREICRVLKTGGMAWISDLRGDVSDDAIKAFVANEMKVTGLAGLFMRYTFTHTLRPRAYTSAQFAAMTDGIPFRRVDTKDNCMDFEATLFT